MLQHLFHSVIFVVCDGCLKHLKDGIGSVGGTIKVVVEEISIRGVYCMEAICCDRRNGCNRHHEESKATIGEALD